jgi:ParB family transcriptional regulator, chromosome partitioning protein
MTLEVNDMRTQKSGTGKAAGAVKKAGAPRTAKTAKTGKPAGIVKKAGAKKAKAARTGKPGKVGKPVAAKTAEPVKAMKALRATPGAAPSGAFFDIPLTLIVAEEQIRSRIDQEGEPFCSLVESIRDKGVLEPIIVTPMEDNYLLISGERRLLACKKAGLPSIPARVIDELASRDEFLALQLTENLQRADLDPIDTAGALVGFFQVRHEEEGLDLGGIVNALVSLERDPERVKKEIADTVSAISKISGKSIRSVVRSCSLLKLPEEIQNALREGTLGVTQGYIFSTNLDHPRLMEIFAEAVEPGYGFTNAELEEELKKAPKPQPGEAVKKSPLPGYSRSLVAMKSGIAEQAGAFKKSELVALLADLKELTALVEGKLPEAVDDTAPVTAVKAGIRKK